MRCLVVTPQWKIPLGEFDFTFSRSAGPGGQNVNKVNSKATLRWNVGASPSLSDQRRGALVARCRRRITVEGELVVTSQRFRDAGRNATDCLEKLRQILVEIAAPPKVRHPTRPTRASKHRRLEAKRQQQQKKRARQQENWS